MRVKSIYLIFSLTFFIIVSSSSAQTYFHQSGDFTNAMNIHPVEAKINNINVAIGDEIGIFDGNICIGVVVIDSDLGGLNDTKVNHGAAGADDSETTDIDGFTEGNSITFRFWDDSEKQEISDVQATYYTNQLDEVAVDPLFEIGKTIFVSLAASLNIKPVADAGKNQTINENTEGSLSAAGSTDAEGQILSYSWNDIDNLGLSSTSAKEPKFTAPDVSVNTDFRVVLTVNDGENDSEPDTVIVTVNSAPSPPVADAGQDIEIIEGKYGELNGSNSYDPEDKEITYKWSDLDGIGLDDLDAMSPVFTAPEVEKDTYFRLVLTVSHNEKMSEPDTIIVTVKHVNKPPIADAGVNRKVQPGDRVILYGEGSKDPDGDEMTCTWVAPEEITLSSTTSVNPEFTAPEVDTEQEFEFVLVVADEWGLKDMSSVIVTVAKNEPPVIITDLYVEVDERQDITLDATSTYDPDEDELVFTWSAFLTNEEHLVTFNDENSKTPTLNVPEIEEDRIIKVKLKVSDGKDRETVLIDLYVTNINRAPVADAGNDIETDEGKEVILDGSGSHDQDGDSIIYNWNIVGFLNFNSESAAIFFTAPEVEQDKIMPVILTVYDGELESEPDTMLMTVLHVNQPPEFASVPEISGEVGYPLSAEVVVTDPDIYDQISIFSTELPDWLELTDFSNGVAVLSSDSVPRLESLIGNHSYVIKASDGKQTIETILHLNISVKTGIEDFKSSKIAVYPNPAADYINISFDYLPEPETIVLFFSQTGQTISEHNVTSQLEQINISLKTGVYYIKIQSNNRIQTKKLVVQ